MKPSEYYAQDIAAGKVAQNSLQEEVLEYLDHLYDELQPHSLNTSGFKQKLKKFFGSEKKEAARKIKGL